MRERAFDSGTHWDGGGGCHNADHTRAKKGKGENRSYAFSTHESYERDRERDRGLQDTLAALFVRKKGDR